MAVRPTSFFLPSNASIPYLLEDTYMRGGWHCVADDAERDNLHVAARKEGMRMYVASSGKTYTLLNDDMTTWVELSEGSSRSTTEISSPSLDVGNSHEFTLATGKTALILKLSVNLADISIECHTTSARNDLNPYKFVSYTGHLTDDGSSVLEDESTQFNRRFAIVSNLESTVGVNTYWRVTNNSSSTLSPIIDITHLTVEA